METIKLSFIVPVYNVALYLRKCVDSLLAQDYNDYEIILVDDGSTDDSPQICDEYVASSLSAAGTSPFNEADHSITPIRVIHQVNAGLSAARNSGILVARGEYLCFVDSDDYWEPNVLGGLMEQVERDKLDVLRFNYQNVHEDGAAFIPFKTGKPYFDYSSQVVDGETFLNERLGYACYAVMFVIKRNLIISNQKSAFSNQLKEKDNCLFTEGIYFEDTDWTPRMLLRAKRVASTPQVVYNYLWREGSITLPDNPIKRMKVLDDKMRLIGGFMRQQKLFKDKRWFTWQIAGTTIGILGSICSCPIQERKRYIQQLKELDVFPVSTYRANWKSKLKIWIANVSPSLYCLLMSVLNSLTHYQK